MRFSLLVAYFFAFNYTLFAQQRNNHQNDTSIRKIDLNEVVVKYTEPDKLSNKVRSQNVFIVLNPSQQENDERMERTYFATKFFLPETDSIQLHSVELKLKPFDSAIFEMKLIVMQITGVDTNFQIVPINGALISRKGYLKMPLYDKDIHLKQGAFYIGFGFHPKNIKETFKYRMYSTSNGEGAILTFNAKGIEIASNPHFPYVFPFKMAYRKL